MKDHSQDYVEYGKLQQKVKQLEDDNIKLYTIVEDLTDDLKTFKSVIKTGKYLVLGIMFAIGVMGHKTYDWFSDLVHNIFYGN